MFSAVSTKEQLQNELQWWGEQKLKATQEGDLVYVHECENNIKKLLKDIQLHG